MKYHYIDATRGIAILLVVACHFMQQAATMFTLSPVATSAADFLRLGVQLFFIASAFTLCLSLDNRGREPLRNFYLRRFFRIAPLYYVAVLIYAAGGRGTATDVALNFSFLHGFSKTAINDVVPGGWSISAEMGFYLWFPFAFIGARWVSDHFGAKPLIVIAGLAAAAQIALWSALPLISGYEMKPGNIFFYWPPAQVPVFLVGVAAYFWKGRAPDAALFCGLIAVAFGLWLAGSSAAYAAAPIVAALAFVFLMRVLARAITHESILTHIGVYSYSMYVFHFLAVWFVAPGLLAILKPLGLFAIPLAFVPVVALAYAMAWVSYRLIETPGNAAGKMLLGHVRRPLRAAR